MRLSISIDKKVAPHTLGEMAHIKGEKPGASRHDATQTQKERDDYKNLVLLCRNHHGEIDKPENEEKFTVEILYKIKAEHETFIDSRLAAEVFENKVEVALAIFPLTQENYQAFKNFGPVSEIAKKDPDSDAHLTWLEERLSTILPNNRRISRCIVDNIGLFSPSEQEILAEFQIHSRTYEQWVIEDTSYEGVVRFPRAFEDLIRELIHASS